VGGPSSPDPSTNALERLEEGPLEERGVIGFEVMMEFEALMPVAQVTDDHPPTLLIHGERDTDVPYEQSVLMAERLSVHGVEHRLLGLAEAEHGLDDGEPAAIDHAFEEAVAFMRRHLLAGD
jgi:dipeptidyl aminopeptidase/acylaminoacyl peptidase